MSNKSNNNPGTNINTTSSNQIRILVESSILVAIGFVLSYLSFLLNLRMPQGGSFTILATLPVLLTGLRHGLKWGLLGGLVYACLQMIFEFYPPPTATVAGYIAVVGLDYFFAFTVMGLSGLFKGKNYGLLFAAPLCMGLRFLSHFISGIVVWGVYAEDAHIWLYSLMYNGTYMGFELVTTMLAGAILYATVPIVFGLKKKPPEKNT